jgi:hypothetical protein
MAGRLLTADHYAAATEQPGEKPALFLGSENRAAGVGADAGADEERAAVAAWPRERNHAKADWHLALAEDTGQPISQACQFAFR